VGAALAMVWPSQKLIRRINLGARNIIDGVGLAALMVVLLLLFQANEKDPFLYHGGFMLLSIATAILIAALAHPASRLALAVGCSPMKWIGERSYGIYLWHFPIIVLTTPAGAHGVNLLRAVLQITAVFVVAAASWKFVENPIRHGSLPRLWESWRSGERSRSSLSRPELAGLAGTFLLLLVAAAGLAGFGATGTAPGHNGLQKSIATKGLPIAATHTACSKVAHIGDSTSNGLESAEYLPNRKQRISAQYARVGARTAFLDISDARSVVEKLENRPNAQEAAISLKRRNRGGCWVLALGLNEADDVYDHSPWGFSKRVDLMMSIIGKDPVLWVNVKTLLSEGGYSNALMEQWNSAVVAACDKYPNMRAYDWPSDVQTNWFTTDQIHYTSEGYKNRAHFIADALLKAFPASGGPGRTDSRNCLIRPEAQVSQMPLTAPATPQATPVN
ncbi:acyltransferase family protein, partial [Aestuariivirga sp.]|uniref:acyltransferase family protein n=1 Tax=Aestuariivirga sp. TaxID=2650926 RepID=UPI00301B4726